jgi:hypothetical protein
MGHQFVNADWNRFKPTNAVNKNQAGWTQYPSASVARTNNPAMRRRYRSIYITTSAGNETVFFTW